MSQPSDYEQLTLELINRSRTDPGGEFARTVVSTNPVIGVQDNITGALDYFNVSMPALEAQFAAMNAAPPLAWSAVLGEVAEGHSLNMLANDVQAHTIGSSSFSSRLDDAGYRGSAGENVFAYTQDMVHGHAGFMVDWGSGALDRDGDGIQDAAGHRVNIMGRDFKEVGVGVVVDSDSTNNVGRPFLMTQNFGNPFGYRAQLVGVVIDDLDGDAFYDLGEGLGGIDVTVSGAGGTFSTTTWASGGYQLAVAPGSYTVTFSGAALGGTVTEQFTIASDNVKVDARAQDAIGAAPGPTTGDDDLVGDGGPDTIDLLAGNDAYRGLGGNDTILGGAGNDRLDGGAGADVLDGGAGLDRAVYGNAATGVTADLLAPGLNTGEAAGDSYVSIENLGGSKFGDVLRGTNGGNLILGLGGDDVIFARGNADRAFGGDGNDRIDGGNGNDRLHGGAGDDTLIGGAGADMLDGGAGTDLAAYVTASAGVRADLARSQTNTGDAAGDSYAGIENLFGSTFDDRLLGDGAANRIMGAAGDDVLAGRAGNDVLIGDRGNDRLFGGLGDDELYGGDGNDTLLGNMGADALYGGAGSDFASYTSAASAVVADLGRAGVWAGEATGDTFFSIEGLLGSRFGDSLRGGERADVIAGNGGDDRLYGRGGNDRLDGGAGDDLLVGGSGIDVLIGGAGADVFAYGGVLNSPANGSDFIVDFERGVDMIDLSVIDAGAGKAGDQRLDFVAAFTGAGGEVTTASGLVLADLDGDRVADLAIRTNGVTLAETDLIL